MKKYLWILLFVLTCQFVASTSAQAQASPTSNVTSIRRNLATVIFFSLGGAVLGISTLSFYGDPQNHLGNIYTGLGLGLVAGTLYVTNQAADNKDAMALDPLKEIQARQAPVKRAQVALWRWDF
jgi:hypothetical protein